MPRREGKGGLVASGSPAAPLGNLDTVTCTYLHTYLAPTGSPFFLFFSFLSSLPPWWFALSFGHHYDYI